MQVIFTTPETLLLDTILGEIPDLMVALSRHCNNVTEFAIILRAFLIGYCNSEDTITKKLVSGTLDYADFNYLANLHYRGK